MALSSIEDSERQANVRARRQFLETLYGAAHPLGRPAIGLKSVVEKLSARIYEPITPRYSCRTTRLSPWSAISRPMRWSPRSRALTADWKPARCARGPPGGPQEAGETVEKIITLPEANQLYVYLGHPGIRRNDPNYYKLLVLDNVLGTGSGFTDRLSANLRDRQGLAYNVSATITADAGDEPGAFTCFIGTFPDKLSAVKKEIAGELERIRGSQPATKEEVENAKKYLLGSLPFHFATSASVAEELLHIERFGLGFDYRAEVPSGREFGDARRRACCGTSVSRSGPFGDCRGGTRSCRRSACPLGEISRWISILIESCATGNCSRASRRRLVTARDGRSVVQVRLDLGILQLEIEGRPDGQRPHGFATYYEYLRDVAQRKARVSKDV